MTGPDDKFLLKMIALVVFGAIALVVAWLFDRRKAAKSLKGVTRPEDNEKGGSV